MVSCPSREALVGHLLVLVLTVSWLTLTGLKVAEYISEPTATTTRWERAHYLPAFTVCPALRTTDLSSGSDPDRENDTLARLFWDLSLYGDDMIQDLGVPEDNSSEFVMCNDYGCLDFKTSTDYDVGGMCFTTTSTMESIAKLVLLPNPLYEHELDNPLTYDLIFHGQSDFIGDVYTEDPTYYMSAAQRGIAITVFTDRHIQDNLRRDPCSDEPNYSKRLCERQCFFDWLNCSLQDDVEASKPRCMASDATWYKEAEPFSVFFAAADGLDACPCPKPCVTDSISVSIRTDYYIEDNNLTYVMIHSAATMKVLRTYLSYSFSDLMADTGGFLGLLLGSSLLSMIQLLPRPVSWIRRDKGGRQARQPSAASDRWAAAKTRVSTYPFSTDSAHRGDMVIRISPGADRPTY